MKERPIVSQKEFEASEQMLDEEVENLFNIGGKNCAAYKKE